MFDATTDAFIEWCCSSSPALAPASCRSALDLVSVVRLFCHDVVLFLIPLTLRVS